MNISDEDKIILARGLNTQHTWLLDAIGDCIDNKNEEMLLKKLKERDNHLRIAEELGYPIEDSLRMNNLRRHAQKEGVIFR